MSRLLDKFPMLHSVVSNVGWRMAERLIAVAFSIGIGAWVARYLGPEEFGVLGAALSIVAFMGVLPHLGLERILVRELVNHPEREGELLGTAGVMMLVSGLISFLVTVGIVFIFPMSREMAWATLLISTWFFGAPALVVRAWFEGNLQGNRDAIAGILGLFVGAGLRIYMIATNQPMWIFAAAIGAEVFLSAAMRCVFFFLAGGRMKGWRFDFSCGVKLLRESMPHALGMIALVIYLRIDTLMVKVLSGDETAGIYAAGARLAEGLYFIPAVMASALLPSLLAVRKSEPAVYRRRLESYFKLNAALGYGLAIVGTLAAPFVVGLLFGPDYAATVGVLMIYIWAAVPYFIGYVRQESFVAEGLVKLNLVMTLIGAVANVTLNFFMIPRWAESGAAIATLISYTIAGLLAPLFFGQARSIGAMALRALIWPVPSLRGLNRKENDNGVVATV